MRGNRIAVLSLDRIKNVDLHRSASTLSENCSGILILGETCNQWASLTECGFREPDLITPLTGHLITLEWRLSVCYCRDMWTPAFEVHFVRWGLRHCGDPNTVIEVLKHVRKETRAGAGQD